VSDLLSTSDAARVAGVSLSTVKRWADSGLLACVKTAGGHRRFPRDRFEQFLREQGAAARERGPLDWIDLLLSATPYEIEGRLLDARGRLGAWWRVADELGSVLREIGECWRDRRISVLDEHLASERLARALARVGDHLPTSSDAPRCLLACADGDEHTLGLSLAEVCLREAGWSPLWSGRRTPTAEVIRRVQSGDLTLVALSASSVSQDAAALVRQAAAIGKACRDARACLVLGGSGRWPDPPSYGARLHLFEAFHDLLLARRR
jgi:MerR family transcriptional regulator, light-induced transcriptional regulator